MKYVIYAASLFGFITITFLLFFSFNFPIEDLPDSFEVITITEGVEANLCDLDTNDSGFKLIKKILSENEGGWYLDINSYAPSLKLYSGTLDMTLSDKWIVNYEHNYLGWIQLSKRIISNLNSGNICGINQ